MNVETFSYSVLTALIGMAVVFGALGLLSVLMYLLRAAFEPRAGERAALAVARRDRQAGASQSSRLLLPRAVVLAAAAYHLQYEERDRESSAAAWTRRLS